MKPTWGLRYFALPLVCAWEKQHPQAGYSGAQGNTDGGLDPWLILSVPSSVCRRHSTWLSSLTSQKSLRHFWKLAVILSSETFEEIPPYTLPVSRAAWPVWES